MSLSPPRLLGPAADSRTLLPRPVDIAINTGGQRHDGVPRLEFSVLEQTMMSCNPGHPGRRALTTVPGSLLEPLEDRRLLSSMVVEVRAPGGGHSAVATEVGQVLQLELWATITGDDSTGENDAVTWLNGGLSSPSTSSGSILGDLWVNLDPDFSAMFSQDSTHPSEGSASTVDIDDDLDNDVGSNAIYGSLSGLLVARSIQRIDPPAGIVDGASRSYRLGQVRFTVISLGDGGSTELVFRPIQQQRFFHGGVWGTESGKPPLKIKPFIVRAASTPVPVEPASREPDPLPLPFGIPPAPPPPDGSSKPPAPPPPPPLPPVETPEAPDDPPAVASLSALLSVPRNAPHTLSLTYLDDRGLQLRSLNSADVVVTGPSGELRPVQFISVNRYTDSRLMTANYRVSGTARNGSFRYEDNGVYTLRLKDNEVRDFGGAAVPGVVLGQFVVDVPPVTLQGGTLAVIGTDGDDVLRIRRKGNFIEVDRSGEIFNFVASTVRAIRVDALGGDDLVIASKAMKPTTFYGGDGGDTLVGSTAADVLAGGAGDDLLEGAGGADHLRGDAGNDTADYSSRPRGVRVSLDGKSNDGYAGERDNVARDIEAILGGRGSDRLIGNAFANRLIGGKGRDTLAGGGGDDNLLGGPGKDVLQ